MLKNPTANFSQLLHWNYSWILKIYRENFRNSSFEHDTFFEIRRWPWSESRLWLARFNRMRGEHCIANTVFTNDMRQNWRKKDLASIFRVWQIFLITVNIVYNQILQEYASPKVLRTISKLPENFHQNVPLTQNFVLGLTRLKCPLPETLYTLDQSKFNPNKTCGMGSWQKLMSDAEDLLNIW